MSFVDHLTPEQVVDPKTFMSYAQQRLGCPYPTGKDQAITRKALKDFFVLYPTLGYDVLVRTVEWCVSKNKRFTRVYKVIPEYRNAYKAGVLGELIDRSEPESDLEEGIREALQVETSREWRERLAGSYGEGRRANFDAWTEKRRPELIGA